MPGLVRASYCGHVELMGSKEHSLGRRVGEVLGKPGALLLAHVVQHASGQANLVSGDGMCG
jgi:hypothetical protein